MVFDDCHHLMDESERMLKEIEEAYGISVAEEQISKSLLIRIKNLTDNLRAALDYLAVLIFEEYCYKKGNSKVYFPYANRGANQQNFEDSLNKFFPGLKENKLDIFLYLVAIQHFGNKEWTWLAKFIEINNQSSHIKLTPQIRRKHVALTISSGASALTLMGTSQVIIEDGGELKVGSVNIKGAQAISVDQHTDIPSGHAQMRSWESIHFEINNAEVLPLLHEAVLQTRNVIKDIQYLMS